MMRVKRDLDLTRMARKLETRAQLALRGAAETLVHDLRASGTMPLESGELQDRATFVESTKRTLRVVSSTVYARRKYFNPQFEFDRSVNRLAGGRWFDAYLSGGKRGFVREVLLKLI